MAKESGIEWTKATWNFFTGCKPVSPACKHCYAKRQALWLQRMGQPKYRDGFTFAYHPECMDEPRKWKQPLKVFVNSMSDTFYEEAPDDVIIKAFDVMNECNWHTYQVLTKRPKRAVEMDPRLRWAPNIWLGVTVENADYKWRIDELRKTGAKTKFISFEALLGDPGKLDLTGVHWAIIGGESGPDCRPMDIEWARSVRDQCVAQNVRLLFKQYHGENRNVIRAKGRMLDGVLWDEYPG